MKLFDQLFLFTLTYFSDVQVTAIEDEYDIINHLSARTPYRFKSNKNDSRITYENCKDHKIWMVIRHGTRLPGPKDIVKLQNLAKVKEEILSQYSHGKGQLSPKQLKEFDEWYSNIPIEHEMFLALEGQEEMVLLAERMQKRFPNAIKQMYNNKTFLLRHTYTERAQQSAKYFAVGLFGKTEAQKIKFPPAKKVDKVLRFYKHCDKWRKEVQKNPETYKEFNLFGISQEMNDTLESVSKRLGLSRVLPLEVAETIYKYCGYETAWHKRRMSVWCNAFDSHTIKVFEYYYDLRSYWLDGYANELTYRQGCLAMKHMFNSLRQEERPQATFLFSHSGTILKILAHLGLYKSESPLTGAHIVEDRSWRTSDIDTFAANIAFVLFKCKGGFHVLTLHQERIIRLPMCPEDLCPLKTLMKYFQNSIKNCDFNEMCSIDVPQSVSTQVYRIMLSKTANVNDEF